MAEDEGTEYRAKEELKQYDEFLNSGHRSEKR